MKVVHVVGARPNFMKVAPIWRVLAARPGGVEQRLVHTGQHYDEAMSQVFFDELELPRPDVNLEVGSGTHAWQTGQVMIRFEPVLIDLAPDWVIVVGDVNSTLACSLVASKLGVRVAHVEAGLRSFDRTMPEEINRLLTDALADLLLTPSADADENLRREGIPDDRIRRVGNVMIDTLCHNLDRARASHTLERFGLTKAGFVYVTLHRPSNVDGAEPLAQIVDNLKAIAKRMPVVFPVHPRTRQRLTDTGLSARLEAAAGVQVVDPLGYHDSLCLTESAACVVTDSGGLQEETTFLGVPCLTLRPNTERPITISHGTNRLTTLSTLTDDLELALGKRANGPRPPAPPLWDGHAAERIVEALIERSR